MNMKKYIKFLVLSLVMIMAFTACSKQKIDDGGIDSDTKMDKTLEETEDVSENLDD